MSRLGRPPIAPEDVRRNCVKVYLTDAELVALEHYRTRPGTQCASRSTWLAERITVYRCATCDQWTEDGDRHIHLEAPED